MNKILFFLLFVGIGQVWGQTTITYSFSDSGAVSGFGNETSLDTNISFESFKNSGTTNPTINSSQLRLYQNATKGGSIKIYANNGVTITKVVVNASGADGIGPAGYSVDNGTATNLSISGGNYTMNTSSTNNVEFFSKGTSSTTRVYVNSFTVTYTLPNIYWDYTAGANNGVGGSATWTNQADTRFSNAATGSATLVAASTTADVIYAGTAGTVTLGGNLTVASQTFNTTNYTFATTGAAIRTLTGTINLNSNTLNLAPINTAGLTLPSIISGTGSLVQNGAGTTILSGANTYSGSTTITSGTVSVAANNNLGSAGALLLNGGTLNVTAGFTIPRTITLNSNSTINVVSGTLTKTGSVISGAGGLTKSGSGILILPTNNTYTGKTIITSGYINTTGESAFGDNPTSFTADQITLNGGGVQASTGNIKFDSNRGITLGTSGGLFDTASARTITLINAVEGAGTLTKTGLGLLLFDAAGTTHTYSGRTFINGGTLQLEKDNIIPDASGITMGGGTFNTARSSDGEGRTETVGTLGLTTNSIIALATSGPDHTITFSGTETWTASRTLTVNNWTGTSGTSGTRGRIIINTTIPATQLQQIKFSGAFTAAVAIQLPSGEIVPYLAPKFTVSVLGTGTFSTCEGTIAATIRSFTLAGENLDGTDVTISCPTSAYTFATTSGGTYSNPLVLSAYNGNSPGQIFVKFSPQTSGSFPENIIVSGGGVATAINGSVAVTGSGVANNTPTLSIAITTGTNPECSGDAVTFTATPSSTGGGTVAYQWTLNGNNTGINAATYANASLSNGDTIRCEISIAGGTCMLATTAVSNNITMTVNASPDITNIKPASGGPVGTLITITGTGFTPGSSVKFGSVDAVNIQFISNTEIQAVVPDGATLNGIEVTNALSCPATSSFNIITQVASGCN